MNILALDTATRTCSVAVLVDGKVSTELMDVSGETHSRHLMTMVGEAVRESGMDVAGFDGFAVTRGPGSFTGLRIGISAVKGLAAAAGKPVVGISSLRVLAAQAGDTSDLIYAVLDARRNEIYGAGFRHQNGRLEQVRPEVVMPPEAAVDGIDERCLLVGDGALLYRERLLDVLGPMASVAPSDCHVIRASTIGFLAVEAFEAGAGIEPAALVPAYIRQSYADPKRWQG